MIPLTYNPGDEFFCVMASSLIVHVRKTVPRSWHAWFHERERCSLLLTHIFPDNHASILTETHAHLKRRTKHALQFETQRQCARVSAYQLQNVETKVSLGVQQPVSYQRTVLRSRNAIKWDHCIALGHNTARLKPHPHLSTYLQLSLTTCPCMPLGQRLQTSPTY